MLIQESQLMIKLVMVLGFDIALRNDYFIKKAHLS